MTTVYVDMVGDLFHCGHVKLLRGASEMGDRLIVGVLGDLEVAKYKRVPIMSLEERVAVIRCCRYVDEVVHDSPGILTEGFLRDHGIDLVVHGEGISETDIEAVYSVPRRLGILRLVPMLPGISTTKIIERVRMREDL